MTAYKVVLFDADGTLFDFHRAEERALEAAFLASNIRYDENLHLPAYRKHNVRIWGEFERGLISSEEMQVERFRRFFEEMGFEGDPAPFGECYIKYLGQGDQLIRGVEEIVAELSGLVRMSIITNGLSAVQRSRFSRSPITRYFDQIIISEEVGARKPEPQIFEAAMRAYSGVQRQDVLMVGDSLSSDIAGGNRFGVHTCWFNPNGEVPMDGEERPTYEIRALNDLPALLHRR